MNDQYKVKSPDGKSLFYIEFIDDISDLGSGFTFDSEDDIWKAEFVDHNSKVIIARTMTEVMNEQLNEYFGTHDKEYDFGYVEA